MVPFIHLHVHTQYSLLDGQASIDALIDKAQKDGMPAIAVTDHGVMFGIKEFFNKVSKKNGKPLGAIKDYEKELKELKSKTEPTAEEKARIEEIPVKINEETKKIFKPIFGCECYCARNGRHSKMASQNDRSGWHLIVLAKNLNGYKNLIKMVSLSWTEGFYGRPRIDKELLEKYHEDLIICSACIGGEIPQHILNGRLDKAEESLLWFKNLFGEDYYLEIQRHETHDPNAAQDVYPHQVTANKTIIELARKHNIKVIATNDVHFVNAEDAEAHDRLICLSTGKDLDDPNRMRYTKQEWMKTTAEMNSIFSDIPEALSNTLEIADKVEFYSIDHGPIMPTFAIPEEFGTEERYRQKFTEQDLFDEFTRDENGNQGFLLLFPGIQRADAVQRRFNGPCLFGEIDRLLEKPCGDMFAACLAGALPTLQVRILLHHIGVKIVLPFRKACPVAQNLFGAQAIVFRQRNESQVEVGRFLVHVNHRRHDIFTAYPLDKKISRPLEKGLYLLWGLALEKLRAGGYQRIDKPGAVLACPAPGLFNAALNEVVIASLRLNDMEIVLALCCVNFRVAGILFFLPFVMGFQRPCRVALVLCKSQDCVLRQSINPPSCGQFEGCFGGGAYKHTAPPRTVPKSP